MRDSLPSELEDRQNNTGISNGTDNHVRGEKTDMKMRSSCRIKIPTFIYMLHLLLSSAGM